jgi:hypothetical protein
MSPELLDRLAADASAVQLRKRSAAAAHAALAAISASVALLWFWVQPRADLTAAVATPIFWLKLAFPAGLALLAWLTLRRLHVPGAASRAPMLGVAGLLATLWALAALTLPSAGAEARSAAIWGSSWALCPLYITALAAPVLPAMLAWSRQYAPLQPRWAGAFAGLASGTIGATLYAVHCREDALAFVGLWYVAGSLVPALIGALAGPRWLAATAAPAEFGRTT